MRILGLIAGYAVALFLTGWMLLDVEAMLVSELTANKELDIPENFLLDVLEDMRYWNHFSVLFTFLILVVKCFLMALVLYGGLFFANLHQGVRLGTLFRVVAFAEVALVLAGVIKVWVGAIASFTYSEFAIYYPLSILSLIGTEAVDPLLFYPLQVANLFEMLYCILIVIFLRQELSFSTSQSIKVGLGSYAVSLLFWMVLILFLTLNFT
ncbi:hypothetical protein [Algoriphagus sp.]|uniref:hypothetical protein n=1 Tax=Algoriphagus sp. TaxID=1872435 RepID=UPI00391CB84C